MDRKILKYLYKFYKNGDYFEYHSLIPVFNKMKKGNDYKYFLNRIRTVLAYLSDCRFLEIDNSNYGKWASVKEGKILYDYINHPISARIINHEGVDFIDRIIASEQKQRTNNFIIANICVTILFSIIVTYLQIQTNKRDLVREEREKSKEQQEFLNSQAQTRRDSLMGVQNDQNRKIINFLLDTSRHK